jgi:hypothetical protein
MTVCILPSNPCLPPWEKLSLYNGITYSGEFFLAIYNQIAPKIIRWHHVFRIKIHKEWMKKPKQHQKFPKYG